jgi:hypothetical protein
VVAVGAGDTTRIYLLKGSGTTEFYRYNTAVNMWESMPSAPLGADGKGFRDGSCIAFDSYLHHVYALKGSTNEFYAYDIVGDSWMTRASLPALGSHGRARMAKSGTSMASFDETYVIKGNGTLEAWSYDEGYNIEWEPILDIPIGGGKRVGTGGSLCWWGSGWPLFSNLFTTKGNRTQEFWAYCRPDRRSDSCIDEQPTATPAASQPKSALLRGVLRIAQPSACELLDASGRKLLVLHPGANDASRLAPGVYFVCESLKPKLQAQAVRKIILTR